jgi:hypothetical protein
MELAPFGVGLPAEPFLGLAPGRFGLGLLELVEAAPDRASVHVMFARKVADAGAATDATADSLHVSLGQLRVCGQRDLPLARDVCWDIVESDIRSAAANARMRRLQGFLRGRVETACDRT